MKVLFTLLFFILSDTLHSFSVIFIWEKGKNAREDTYTERKELNKQINLRKLIRKHISPFLNRVLFIHLGNKNVIYQIYAFY